MFKGTRRAPDMQASWMIESGRRTPSMRANRKSERVVNGIFSHH